jgi:hypothetical protein
LLKELDGLVRSGALEKVGRHHVRAWKGREIELPDGTTASDDPSLKTAFRLAMDVLPETPGSPLCSEPTLRPNPREPQCDGNPAQRERGRLPATLHRLRLDAELLADLARLATER